MSDGERSVDQKHSHCENVGHHASDRTATCVWCWLNTHSYTSIAKYVAITTIWGPLKQMVVNIQCLTSCQKFNHP